MRSRRMIRSLARHLAGALALIFALWAIGVLAGVVVLGFRWVAG